MIHRIGRAEFDTELHELRGPDGAMTLRKQLHELLLYLVNHRNRVVRREELLSAIWGNAQVTRASLPQCAKLLRRALQKVGGDGRDVRTAHGKGYLLAAEGAPDERGFIIGRASGFVGRLRELETLELLLHAAEHGDGGLAFVMGEAGIGKSRMAEEVLRMAPGFGVLAWQGRCPEAEHAAPFWPWTEILRSDAANREQSDLRKLAGHEAGEVARLVPDFAALLDVEVTPSAFLEPESERLRLYDGLARYFSRIAREQPLVLLLDDLHRADRATLALLRFFAPRLRMSRVLIIGTYREAELHEVEWRERAIVDATRAAAARVLQLEGLSRDEVATFLAHRMATLPEQQIVDVLHEKTGGNPFFLTQLAPLFDSKEGERALTARTGDWPSLLPRNVRDAIAAQLSGLGSSGREILDWAAVIGREFTILELASMRGDAMEILAPPLLEAQRLGIVQSFGANNGGYRFAHDLVRDLLYGALPAVERAQRHRRFAYALEASANDSAEHIARLAHHFLLAVDGATGSGKAIEYSVRTAELATARLAHEEAIEHLQTALALAERDGAFDESRRCDLLLALGTAQMRAGARETARATLDEAAELARRIGSGEHLARAALSLSPGLLAFEIGFDSHLVGLLEEALSRMGESIHPLRARLLAQLSMRLVWSNRKEHRRDLSSKTVSVARRVGDPATLAFALCARHATLMGARQFERRQQVVAEIGRLAHRTRDASLALLHSVFQIRIMLEKGDLDTAARELGRYESIVEEHAMHHAGWYSDQFRAMQALLRGDFDAVGQHCAKLLRAAEQMREGTALQSYNSIDCLRRRACGKVDEAVTILEGVVRQFPELRSMRCALAQINCEAGRSERGRELYDELIANVRQLPEDEVWGNSVAALCEACCELGDKGNAQLLYDLVVPAQDRFFVLHFGMAILSSVARICGRLATLLGEWETAARHFREALQRERALGSPPLVARSELDFAKMLQARGRKRDRERAQRLLVSAAQTAGSLGMLQLERETRAAAAGQV